ncbi:hypothetical protein PRNP1_003409 [Phytophthora ramorum]
MAKVQRTFAAKEHNAQLARIKQTTNDPSVSRRGSKSRQEASRTYCCAAVLALFELALNQQDAALVTAGVVAVPPFIKSTSCFVCGKMFGCALHRLCRKSCCLYYTSRTHRTVPLFGLQKLQ